MGKESSSAFEEVALCHLDLVYRMARSLTRSVHEAEELVQETFLRAHRAFERFDLRTYGAKPWLLKILHNAYFTRRGQHLRERSLMEDVSLDEVAAEIERDDLSQFDPEEVGWEQFDDEVKKAVDALPQEYRSVLLLWSLGDLSYKEIAEVLNCAMGTVMSRLYRGRQLLNESLADYARRRGIRVQREVI